MVVQLALGFVVGGPNPGRADMAMAPPTTVAGPEFEPPTYSSTVGCVTI